MKVLAILQNLWVKDPARVKEMMERHGRIRVLRTLLFWGGLTGRRLMEGLGEKWCNEIIWEEASPEIGGHSGSVFKGDFDHVWNLVLTEKPDIVITFGEVARKAFNGVSKKILPKTEIEAVQFYHCPHPTARRLSIGQIAKELKQCRAWLDEQVEAGE